MQSITERNRELDDFLRQTSGGLGSVPGEQPLARRSARAVGAAAPVAGLMADTIHEEQNEGEHHTPQEEPVDTSPAQAPAPATPQPEAAAAAEPPTPTLPHVEGPTPAERPARASPQAGDTAKPAHGSPGKAAPAPWPLVPRRMSTDAPAAVAASPPTAAEAPAMILAEDVQAQQAPDNLEGSGDQTAGLSAECACPAELQGQGRPADVSLGAPAGLVEPQAGVAPPQPFAPNAANASTAASEQAADGVYAVGAAAAAHVAYAVLGSASPAPEAASGPGAPAANVTMAQPDSSAVIEAVAIDHPSVDPSADALVDPTVHVAPAFPGEIAGSALEQLAGGNVQDARIPMQAVRSMLPEASEVPPVDPQAAEPNAAAVPPQLARAAPPLPSEVPPDPADTAAEPASERAAAQAPVVGAVAAQAEEAAGEPAVLHRCATAAEEPAAPELAIAAAEEPAAPELAIAAPDESAAPELAIAAADEPAAPELAIAAADEPAAPELAIAAADESAAPELAIAAADESAAPELAIAAADEPVAPELAIAAADESALPCPADAAADEPALLGSAVSAADDHAALVPDDMTAGGVHATDSPTQDASAACESALPTPSDEAAADPDAAAAVEHCARGLPIAADGELVAPSHHATTTPANATMAPANAAVGGRAAPGSANVDAGEFEVSERLAAATLGQPVVPGLAAGTADAAAAPCAADAARATSAAPSPAAAAAGEPAPPNSAAAPADEGAALGLAAAEAVADAVEGERATLAPPPAPQHALCDAASAPTVAAAFAAQSNEPSVCPRDEVGEAIEGASDLADAGHGQAAGAELAPPHPASAAAGLGQESGSQATTASERPSTVGDEPDGAAPHGTEAYRMVPVLRHSAPADAAGAVAPPLHAAEGSIAAPAISHPELPPVRVSLEGPAAQDPAAHAQASPFVIAATASAIPDHLNDGGSGCSTPMDSGVTYFSGMHVMLPFPPTDNPAYEASATAAADGEHSHLPGSALRRSGTLPAAASDIAAQERVPSLPVHNPAFDDSCTCTPRDPEAEAAARAAMASSPVQVALRERLPSLPVHNPVFDAAALADPLAAADGMDGCGGRPPGASPVEMALRERLPSLPVRNPTFDDEEAMTPVGLEAAMAAGEAPGPDACPGLATGGAAVPMESELADQEVVTATRMLVLSPSRGARQGVAPAAVITVPSELRASAAMGPMTPLPEAGGLRASGSPASPHRQPADAAALMPPPDNAAAGAAGQQPAASDAASTGHLTRDEAVAAAPDHSGSNAGNIEGMGAAVEEEGSAHVGAASSSADQPAATASEPASGAEAALATATAGPPAAAAPQLHADSGGLCVAAGSGAAVLQQHASRAAGGVVPEGVAAAAPALAHASAQPVEVEAGPGSGTSADEAAAEEEAEAQDSPAAPGAATAEPAGTPLPAGLPGSGALPPAAAPVEAQPDAAAGSPKKAPGQLPASGSHVRTGCITVDAETASSSSGFAEGEKAIAGVAKEVDAVAAIEAMQPGSADVEAAGAGGGHAQGAKDGAEMLVVRVVDTPPPAVCNISSMVPASRFVCAAMPRAPAEEAVGEEGDGGEETQQLKAAAPESQARGGAGAKAKPKRRGFTCFGCISAAQGDA